MRRGTLMIMIVVLTLLPLAAFAGQTDSPRRSCIRQRYVHAARGRVREPPEPYRLMV